MKHLLILTLVFATCFASAQSIETIKENLFGHKLADAKEGIDKYTTNPKKSTKADGWFYKATIYNAIANDSSLALKYLDARDVAFDSYKKYLELDPKNELGAQSQNGVLFDLAGKYQNLAFQSFRENNFEKSYNAFKNSEKIEDFITAHNFTYSDKINNINFAYPKLDTQLYLNIAVTASKCNKLDVALEYYKKIADNKIKSEGFAEIYKYIVNEAYKKGNMAEAKKYSTIGLELYPDDYYWCGYELDALENKHEELFAKYEELLQSEKCNTYYNQYNYCVSLYNYCYTGDKKSDIIGKKDRLLAILNQIISKNPTPEAYVLAGRTYYEIAWGFEDTQIAMKRAKKTVPTELINSENKALDNLSAFASKAMKLYEEKNKAELKGMDKGNYKVAANLMYEYYMLKGLKDKAEEYKGKTMD